MKVSNSSENIPLFGSDNDFNLSDLQGALPKSDNVLIPYTLSRDLHQILESADDDTHLETVDRILDLLSDFDYYNFLEADERATIFALCALQSLLKNQKIDSDLSCRLVTTCLEISQNLTDFYATTQNNTQFYDYANIEQVLDQNTDPTFALSVLTEALETQQTEFTNFNCTKENSLFYRMQPILSILSLLPRQDLSTTQNLFYDHFADLDPESFQNEQILPYLAIISYKCIDALTCDKPLDFTYPKDLSVCTLNTLLQDSKYRDFILNALSSLTPSDQTLDLFLQTLSLDSIDALLIHLKKATNAELTIAQSQIPYNELAPSDFDTMFKALSHNSQCTPKILLEFSTHALERYKSKPLSLPSLTILFDSASKNAGSELESSKALIKQISKSKIDLSESLYNIAFYEEFCRLDKKGFPTSNSLLTDIETVLISAKTAFLAANVNIKMLDDLKAQLLEQLMKLSNDPRGKTALEKSFYIIRIDTVFSKFDPESLERKKLYVINKKLLQGKEGLIDLLKDGDQYTLDAVYTLYKNTFTTYRDFEAILHALLHNSETPSNLLAITALFIQHFSRCTFHPTVAETIHTLLTQNKANSQQAIPIISLLGKVNWEISEELLKNKLTQLQKIEKILKPYLPNHPIIKQCAAITMYIDLQPTLLASLTENSKKLYRAIELFKNIPKGLLPDSPEEFNLLYDAIMSHTQAPLDQKIQLLGLTLEIFSQTPLEITTGNKIFELVQTLDKKVRQIATELTTLTTRHCWDFSKIPTLEITTKFDDLFKQVRRTLALLESKDFSSTKHLILSHLQTKIYSPTGRAIEDKLNYLGEIIKIFNQHDPKSEVIIHAYEQQQNILEQIDIERPQGRTFEANLQYYDDILKIFKRYAPQSIAIEQIQKRQIAMATGTTVYSKKKPFMKKWTQ